MGPWIEARDYSYPSGWAGDAQGRSRWYCEQLEQNQILFFRQPPWKLPQSDLEFLRGWQQADSQIHKNVSYRPAADVLRGFQGGTEERKRFHGILRNYSANVVRFASEFLFPYTSDLEVDFASFRPFEEKGRALPLHKRNDLVHVDAFPSRPTRGGRILRVFMNAHNAKPRVWITTDPFPRLAERFASDAGLEKVAARNPSTMRRWLNGLFRLPDRSAYDRFMLRFHDYLKENAAFQAGCPKARLEFPPMSAWVAFTDGVPHAVLSGQFALEQTFIIPTEALVAPQQAPIRVLEALCGRHLA